MQAKLEIGASDDPLEREADASADQVMRVADGSGASVPGGSRAGQRSQRTAIARPGRRCCHAFLCPVALWPRLRPMCASTPTARRRNRRRRSTRAPTPAGSDIVFGPGQYAPHTQAGQRLLAHELTHVAQQADGRSGAIQRDVINMPAETITSTRNPVERAVPGLGQLAGAGRDQRRPDVGPRPAVDHTERADAHRRAALPRRRLGRRHHPDEAGAVRHGGRYGQRRNPLRAGGGDGQPHHARPGGRDQLPALDDPGGDDVAPHGPA